MNKNTRKRRSMKGGDCGCNTPTVTTGGCSNCGMTGGGCGCSMKGGSAYLDKVPVSNYYALNDYNHDPNMLQESVRIGGVPLSNQLNLIKGGKKYKKSKKSKKSKKINTKKTRKQKHAYKKMKGGLNLGYSAANSALGHGHFGTWFGAPTLETPAWNSSIFSHPTNTNYTGYNQFNPYLV
jgi:hypothetical protein